MTGALPDGPAPPAALHLVYATDLTFFVVPLGVTTVLLRRRTPWGSCSVGFAAAAVALLATMHQPAAAQPDGDRVVHHRMV